MLRAILLASMVIVLTACGKPSQETAAAVATPQDGKTPASDYSVDVHYETLENGLRVVVSPDDTAPLATVAVYYDIGFRIEPEDRTGFAHLFEHMMFQGSANLGKMEFVRLVQNNGGTLNGSTRFDFTNYYQVIPSHTVETILWAEADRMRGLNITQENLTNQQGVVQNEVKVNVLNQPYGGFPWLDLPQAAFDNWFNSHNFYGDLEDLQAANLEDVKRFFDTYYTPNNAVVVVTGDVDIQTTLAHITKYFGDIPSRPLAAKPDISEKPQTSERIRSRYDPLAPTPAYSLAYRMPERNTPEYFAMGIIDQFLVQGDDSLLFQEIVKKNEISGSISGGINWALGNQWNYNGPMLWLAHFTHDESHSVENITDTIDAAIQPIVEKGLTEEQIALAKVKLLSAFYDNLGSFYGFGKADLLASFTLFDDNPARINDILAEYEKVTPALIKETAAKYLVPTNRTIFTIKPGQAPTACESGQTLVVGACQSVESAEAE